MLKVVNTERGVRKRKAPLSRDMAMAIVGGINELVLQAIECNRLGQLQELAVPAIQLVRAVTREGDAATS